MKFWRKKRVFAILLLTFLIFFIFFEQLVHRTSIVPYSL